MRLKKVTALILTAVLTSTLISGVSANSENRIQRMFEEAVQTNIVSAYSNEGNGAFCKVILSDDAGDKFFVKAFEYVPATSYNVITEEHSKTYVYCVSPEYITPYTNGNTQTNGGWDSTYSVYGSVTVTYNTRPHDNSVAEEYLLTKVSGSWEIKDRSVSISDRFVAYTCQGVGEQSQITQKTPTSNSFSYSTGYKNYVTDDTISTIVGAHSEVTLKRGIYDTHPWSLVVNANLVTRDIGDILFPGGEH